MHISRLTLLVGMLLTAAIVISACAQVPSAVPTTSAPSSAPAAAPSIAPSTSSSASSSASSSSASAAAGLNISDTSVLGSFIADSAGRTLYIFDKDTKGTSNCTSGTCAQNWHPLTAVDKSKLQSGIDATLLGTIQRPDGSSQVTYNGLPLYYFIGDKNAGDTKGQGVGGLWWVISPAGTPIKTSGAGSSAAPAPAPTQAPASGGYGGYGQ